MSSPAPTLLDLIIHIRSHLGEDLSSLPISPRYEFENTIIDSHSLALSATTSRGDASEELIFAAPKDWSKEWSNSQNRAYYFHGPSNRRVWDLVEVPLEERRTLNESVKARLSKATISVKRQKGEEDLLKLPRLAVIVPFRDVDARQKRKAHLEKFAPYMHTFLSKLVRDGKLRDFKVFVVEQSDDQRKFNRGKLLNIGFVLAEREGFDTFVFHDVDLLPQDVVAEFYGKKPLENSPIHIARCWNRYNQNEKYLGGIVTFSKEDFVKIDGFPNVYWGWGGEDDELAKRVGVCKFHIDGPDRALPNAIVDLEEMSLPEKLQWLKADRDIKCNIKWEVNDLHDLYRESNPKPAWWGVAELKVVDVGNSSDIDAVKVLARDDLSFQSCSVVTVDVAWNYENDGKEQWTNSAVVPVDFAEKVKASRSR